MSETEHRPDPDELLRRMKEEEQREHRAKLKIFFGFAPGVGKTFAMLESARRLKQQGVDVVIGCVETHGRRETAALIEGLPVLPYKDVEYRGTALKEFDVAAALQRRPAVLLLDELAHSNAPGSRHPKRYQDVLELLDAGIEVHTTINVQHIESLNDVIAQITSVKVRETVPDMILDRADEIELIDLPPEELLSRLKEGKVYLGEQAERAAQHFFQRGNLLALRELSMRRIAERVNAEVRAYRSDHAIQKTWGSSERLLVCVSSAPASAKLLRSARRMADRLGAHWTVAYVDMGVERPVSERDRATLDSHLRLAESLGAEVVRLTGSKVSDALLGYARRHDITRIILGKPTHSRWRDMVRGSLLDEVVRGSGEIDVLAIRGDGQAAPTAVKVRREINGITIASAVSLVAAATLLSWIGKSIFALPDVVMIYLFVIMLSAVRFGREAAITAATLSVAAYDFFFVPPFFTFAISDTRHLLTFLMMFGVGLLLSGLTLRIKNQERAALYREARTSALYSLSRALSADALPYQALVTQAAASFESHVTLLCPTEEEALRVVASTGDTDLQAPEQGVAHWVLQHRKNAGLGTDTLPNAKIIGAPLISNHEKVVGVLALSPKDGRPLSLEMQELLSAFCQQGAIAIERALLSEEARSAALRAKTEELRSTLLSAVSHDLRTPLAVITGAATTMLDDSLKLSNHQRNELMHSICEEAERLESLVANLLDMTRLASGGIRLKRDWVPLEEIVGGALTRLEHKLKERTIHIQIPEELPLLWVDPVLLGQVFVNLLENASKYTPPKTSIEISASHDRDKVSITIDDHGPGFAKDEAEKIFEKFYRGLHTGAGGVGLGLAICRGMMTAHNGTITAQNRPEGGARFVVTLPIHPQPPTTNE